MSSAKKQIIIDHGNLSTANNTSLKRPRKIKPPALFRHSTLKHQLLKKIQEHKQRTEETPGNGNNSSSNTNALSNRDLSSQFKMSTNYLEQLIQKKEARKNNKKSLSKPRMQPQSMQSMPQPMQSIPQPMQSIQSMQSMPQPIQSIQSIPQPMQSMPIPMPQPMQSIPQQMQSMPQPMQEVSLELPPELQINPIALQSQLQQLQQPQEVIAPQQLQQPQEVIAAQQPQEVIAIKLNDDVPYGCLRGGNKPTFRTYNSTVKKPLFDATNAASPIVDENEDPMIQERQRKLREIQENFHNQNAPNNFKPEPTQIKNLIKQTTTKKYKLGKTPGSNVVGVLIKNNDTRRKIQEEHGVLRRESIVEIRKYLHDHGLIKVGSDAPPDVLRNIYESAKMTGEISNTNKHVMLHNFLKSDDNA